jgi:hypothetical protein
LPGGGPTLFRVVSCVAREELFGCRGDVAARYRCVVGSPPRGRLDSQIEHGDRREGGVRHGTHVIFHEVDDVEHWLQSPKREEVFGPLGITIRTFRDPQGSNRVGLIAEIPDMDKFQEFMQTDAAAEAMKHDGVRPETLLVLDEG